MKPGVVLGQKYRLVSLLGEGGMGAVWRAEDVRLAAPVAIKLMHERDAENPELRARFDAEARIAAKLRSPHVVQLYDVGEDEARGVPFLAMELLEGETLQDRLARGGPLQPSEVARLVAHVARALTRAHALGVVHRDLKPANIFLVRNADSDLAKVLDFGVAKRATHSLQQGRTATGVLLGTPLYMSPEQILSSKDVTHHADLWSLAVIAVQCLTGQLPFQSDNLPGLALQICHGKATPPSRLGQVPPGLDAWFERGTRARPEERFASAVELAEALRAVCERRAPDAELGSAALLSTRVEPMALSAPAASAGTSSVGPLSHTTPDSAPVRQGRRTLRWLGGGAAAALAAVALFALRPSSDVTAEPRRGSALATVPSPAAEAPPRDTGVAARQPAPAASPDMPAAAQEPAPQPQRREPTVQLAGPEPTPAPAVARTPLTVEARPRKAPAARSAAPARPRGAGARPAEPARSAPAAAPTTSPAPDPFRTF